MKLLRKLIILVALVALVLAAAPTLSASVRGARQAVVCLDAGHGGTESGAVYNGVVEKVPNLDIARRARPILQSMGYLVKMTRETDATVSLQRRCDIANAARADIFLSIHNNAYLTTSEGTETFCYYNSVKGSRLARMVHSEVVRRIRLPNRGVKQAGFYVLRHTDMPAALLEGCFLTNRKEARLLKDPNFRQKIAEGVAAGIRDYFSNISWPEEYDPGRFDEYIMLLNPDKKRHAKLEVQYMMENGVKKIFSQDVPPHTRRSIRVDQYVPNHDVSTYIRGTNEVPVVAERVQYFAFDRGRGGHGAPGVTVPARQWYLAEGSTAWGYSSFICIQNPTGARNPTAVRLMGVDGKVTRKNYTIPAHSRFTLDCSTVPGFKNVDFSAMVTSTNPVVVERCMYWNNGAGRSGGHDSPGLTAPGTRWYLAEGYTGGEFDTYVTLQNPNGATARASVTYLLPQGAAKTVDYELVPWSRRTIYVNSVPDLQNTDVSFRIASDLPILAERSMYFEYFGIMEGSNSTATDAPSRDWYLAEGYTGQGFDTYITLMNPGEEEAGVMLRFMTDTGIVRRYWLSVPARSRRTVKVNDVKGMNGRGFGTHVTSDQPVVVERCKYYSYGSKSGGDDAMGAKEPSLRWYFAEGCTR